MCGASSSHIFFLLGTSLNFTSGVLSVVYHFYYSSRTTTTTISLGLCLAGVGYDMTDLAKNKFSGKRSDGEFS